MVLRSKSFKTVAIVLVLAMLQILCSFQPVLALGDFTPPSPIAATPIDMNTRPIAPGVVQINYIFNDRDGQRMHTYVLDIDIPNHPELKIEAGLPNDGKGTPWYGMQPMSQQASAATRPGHQVIAAINGDFYNMSNGYPYGIVVKDGVILKDGLDADRCFFGMKKDGTYIMGDGNLFNQVKYDLQQALSGNAQIIRNGKRDEKEILKVGSGGSEYHPRSGIGVRQDGSIFFVVADGRQTGFSRGFTMSDFADYMLSLGAYNAINLDGGGSSTMVARSPGTDDLEVVNSPSDGTERPVANGFLLVSTATTDHRFASAYVYPNGITVTPNSTVQFYAKGQDSTGASADLPDTGLSWSLSDDSFGTIDPVTGLFTSNGKQGQFKILLNYNGNQVGSAWLEVAVPDTLSFAQSEISLDYGAAKSLGLIARYKGRDVKLKPGDIVWDNIPEGMGYMDENNVFHAASDGSFDTNIVATFAGTDTSASIHVLLGQLPVVLYDFENGIGDWKPGTAGRGEICELQWNTYPNDLTRFGNHSLQINFDFTKGKINTTLGCYAGPAASKDIPGRPKAIGAWVYATPEAQGYWLRCYIYDAKGQYQPINFTTQSEGINWMGWKYVEAPIPDNLVGPFKTFPNQMFRIMSLKSGMPDGNPMRKGFIVIDNVRVTYGAYVDDMYPPIIHGINVDGKTFTSSHVEISASFDEDTSDKYATGINYDRVRIFVDGKEYTHAEGVYALNKGLNTVAVSNMSFQDGIHRVDVNIQDNFGNEAVKTAYFTVNTGSGTSVWISSPDNKAKLGGIYRIDIITNNSADITGIFAQIKVGKEFPVAGVDFAPSASDSTYNYDASTGIVSLDITNASSDKNQAVLATINISIPGTTFPGAKLNYDVLTSDIKYASEKPSLFAPTFCAKPTSVDVVSALNLTIKSALVGKPGIVTVTDDKGNPVEGATVKINVGGILSDVGITDASGTAICPLMTDTVKKFDIFAQKDDLLSFATTTQSFAALKDKIPSNIISGATPDPTTMKTITWMSNPLSTEADSIMQIAEKTDYIANGEKAFKNVKGTSKELIYSGSQDINSNGIVKVNCVTVTNLTPGTTYSFRVGDGVNWSDVREFTMLARTDKFTFNVFGDTQSPDTAGLANFDSMLTAIESKATNPDFSIHVGDFTDDAGKFEQMDAITNLLSSHKVFSSIDMIHVLGNHEYMGDDGSKAVAIFGNPKNGPNVNPAGCYSVDYGNMHIAVIGWTEDPNIMHGELDWLRQDMNASNKLWKVVCTHQPVYNTNPDDSTMFKTMLAPVCDELGIDLVFSGHDHAYGRTKQMKEGIETAGGTIYIVAGTTGPKHYTTVNDGNFEVLNDDNIAVYITGEVNGGSIEFTVQTKDGTIVDQFTVQKQPANIAVFPENVKLNIGESKTIAAAVYDQYGDKIPLTVNWEIDDTGIANLSIDGNFATITGMNVGSTVLRAVYGELTAKVDVTVEKPLEQDITPPALLATIPEDGSTGISITPTIKAIFTETLDSHSVLDTVYGSVYMLKGEEPVDIHIKLSSSSGNTDNEIIITPENPLDYNTKYKIILGSAIKDASGNNFEGYSFTFTTMKRPAGRHHRHSGTDNSNKTQEASPPVSNTAPPAVQPAPQISEPVFAKTFEDIKSHWAQKEIELLAGIGIIKGISRDRFEPNKNITRAELAALLANLLGLTQSGEIPFKDIPAGAWYYDSVSKAYKAGLIKGASQDMFNPTAPITRQEMATMIVRTMEKLGIMPEINPEEEKDILSRFNDRNSISSWAADALAAAIKAGIISGRSGNIIAPSDNASRAEAAVMLYRLLQAAGRIK